MVHLPLFNLFTLSMCRLCSHLAVSCCCFSDDCCICSFVEIFGNMLFVLSVTYLFTSRLLHFDFIVELLMNWMTLVFKLAVLWCLTRHS